MLFKKQRAFYGTSFPSLFFKPNSSYIFNILVSEILFEITSTKTDLCQLKINSGDYLGKNTNLGVFNNNLVLVS